MPSEADEENRGKGFRKLLLVLAGMLTFGAPGLSWAVAESGGEPAVTDADVREFALTLVRHPMGETESTASLGDTPGAGTIRDLGTNASRSTVRIGARYVNLEPPAGHCFLDEAQPRDKRLTGILRSGFQSGALRLVGAFTDCTQLESWRRGGRSGFDNYGLLLIPADFIDKAMEDPPETHVRTVCRMMRGETGADVPQGGEPQARRIEAALQGAQPGEMRLLGIVGEDGRACYAGFVQIRDEESGEANLLLGVAAIGFVSGKMIYSTLYAVHEGDQTLRELLARQRQAVERRG